VIIIPAESILGFPVKIVKGIILLNFYGTRDRAGRSLRPHRVQSYPKPIDSRGFLYQGEKLFIGANLGSGVRFHGIRFSDAEMVLFDPNALTREDMIADGEQRFVTVGADTIGRALVVVYAYRGEDIRLISARSATKREKKSHEEGI